MNAFVQRVRPRVHPGGTSERVLESLAVVLEVVARLRAGRPRVRRGGARERVGRGPRRTGRRRGGRGRERGAVDGARARHRRRCADGGPGGRRAAGKPGLGRGLVAHAGISLGWGAVLGATLPRRHTIAAGAVAGLAIAALDLGLVGRRIPEIAALPLAPQVLDHLAFGAVVGATSPPSTRLSRARRRRGHVPGRGRGAAARETSPRVSRRRPRPARGAPPPCAWRRSRGRRRRR